MKLTKISELLISFFLKDKCINKNSKSKQFPNEIFEKLYNEIRTADIYLNKMKKNNSFYNIKIKEINNSKQIPKPKTFASNGFPSDIRKYIDENIMIEIEYNIKLLDKNIKIYFLLEEGFNKDKDIKKYNKYIDNILLWLLIINDYASKECATELTIYIYLTNLKKEIPNSNITVLNEMHANTAFTMTCPLKAEIVIYRKEEWFKVLLHETFHNFGLDFSDMNTEACKSEILNIFPVASEVNLYEAYAEFWAKIMNVLFCSYIHLKNKNNVDDFLTSCENLINFEIKYSCFQMIKVLDFMDLNYKQLYQKGLKNEIARNNLYKEKTNILAYYIITFILLDNYGKFIEWCSNNNLSLLQFKKTLVNQMNFCKFISNNFRSKHLLDDIQCVELFYNKLLNNNINIKDQYYLMNNLRMSICELG
jgi:hypothetical protein